MIKIENLDFSFENKKFFQNQNISFEENKINVITGLNGSGKTTILRILSKSIKSDAKINLKGKKIFCLPQIITYPKNITLFEYLSSIFYSNWKWIISDEEKSKILNILKEFELEKKSDLIIENLSSGELQKANIALGILSGANLLLLDEPTSNLDLINQIKIFDIIKTLPQKGITVITILHDINLALKYGEFFIGITPEKEIICNKKELFFNEKILKKIYTVEFKVNKNAKDIQIQVVD